MAPDIFWNLELTNLGLISPFFGYCAPFCVREIPHLMWEHQTPPFPASGDLGWSREIGNDLGFTKQMQPHPGPALPSNPTFGGVVLPQARLRWVSPCVLMCRFPKGWELPVPPSPSLFCWVSNSCCLGCRLLSPQSSHLAFLLTIRSRVAQVAMCPDQNIHLPGFLLPRVKAAGWGSWESFANKAVMAPLPSLLPFSFSPPSLVFAAVRRSWTWTWGMQEGKGGGGTCEAVKWWGWSWGRGGGVRSKVLWVPWRKNWSPASFLM